MFFGCIVLFFVCVFTLQQYRRYSSSVEIACSKHQPLKPATLVVVKRKAMASVSSSEQRKREKKILDALASTQHSSSQRVCLRG